MPVCAPRVPALRRAADLTTAPSSRLVHHLDERCTPCLSPSRHPHPSTLASRRLATHRTTAPAPPSDPLHSPLEQLVAYLDEGAADALPPALHALLAARLDRLDTAERSALALGAVAGDAFAPAAVHVLAGGITRAELDRALDGLVGRDLLVAWGGAAGCASATASSARRPTPRSRRPRGRGCTSATRTGSTCSGSRCRRPMRGSRFTSRPPGATTRDPAPRRPSSRVAPAGVWPRRPESRAVAGTCRARSASSTARWRCSAPSREQGAELLPELVSALVEAGASARAEELAQRAMATSAALGLPRVGAWAAIERERIRLSRYPETFDVPAADRPSPSRRPARSARSATSLASRAPST